MTLPPLTVIPAGAGSGKTYTLQQQLGAWVEQGLVQPERIVAVTFTEAAAAELKERIGSQLLALGRVEDALRLEEAYVSTIHGFGLRVLTEFAFESGSSPQPRLLNEDEQNALIRLALARTTATDAITENLAAYGYAYDFMSGKSAEDGFRDDVLEIIGLLRAMGWQAYSDDYARQAAEWIAERYGPVEEAATLSAALRTSAAVLLERFPESLAGLYPTNKSATDALQKDFRNLRAAADGEALERDWNLWKCLRQLRQSKRGAALPDGYDGCADAVMAAAAALPRHPGPLAHAQRHIAALLAAGQEVLVQYETAKREAGLVDYSDMIALAGQLLRRRPEVLATLKRRVDCLVVDEFQDTNPLQFELLWQLAVAGVPTVVVGDLKQAIMGFQGADPRLFEALAAQNAAACQPLTRNWRSQPALMAFVNALGPQLFGPEYIALDAAAQGHRAQAARSRVVPGEGQEETGPGAGARGRAAPQGAARGPRNANRGSPHEAGATTARCGSRGAVSDAQHDRGVRGGAAGAGAQGAGAGGRLVRLARGADRVCGARLSREPGRSPRGAHACGHGARFAHAQGRAHAADGQRTDRGTAADATRRAGGGNQRTDDLRTRGGHDHGTGAVRYRSAVAGGRTGAGEPAQAARGGG